MPLWARRTRLFHEGNRPRAARGRSRSCRAQPQGPVDACWTPGLELAATLTREDPRDALLSRAGVPVLKDLPPGARVGTSSLRRRAFLSRARPDLKLLELRGNVPTRVERLKNGDYDAIVLAAAGLRRLGLQDAYHRVTCRRMTSRRPCHRASLVLRAAAAMPRRSRWLRPLDDRGGAPRHDGRAGAAATAGGWLPGAARRARHVDRRHAASCTPPCARWTAPILTARGEIEPSRRGDAVTSGSASPRSCSPKGRAASSIAHERSRTLRWPAP